MKISYYDGNDKIWVPKHGVTSFVSCTLTCHLTPANPNLVEDRGKDRMAEYFTLVPKQAQSIPSSQGQEESQLTSSSFCPSSNNEEVIAHPPLITENTEGTTPSCSTIPATETPPVRSWESLDVALGVARTYWPRSPPITNWNNWFQRVTTSFQKV